MRSILLVLLTLGVVACGVQPPIPEPQYYRLAAAEHVDSVDRLIPGTLAVKAMTSSGLHAERAILYSLDPGHRALSQYHYRLWVAPPPNLVQGFLMDFLRRSGVAKTVVKGYSDYVDAYLVFGEIQRFERLLMKDGVAVSVSLELGLQSPGATRPTASREYAVVVPAMDGSMTSTAAAFEEALARIAGRFLRDLRVDLTDSETGSEEQGG